MFVDNYTVDPNTGLLTQGEEERREQENSRYKCSHWTSILSPDRRADSVVVTSGEPIARAGLVFARFTTWRCNVPTAA